jgi:hypothetical protein
MTLPALLSDRNQSADMVEPSVTMTVANREKSQDSSEAAGIT